MALGGLKICCGTIQCGGMFFGIGIKMKKIKALHLQLQKIVDENYQIYWTTEQRCRKITKIMGFSVFFSISPFLVVMLYVLYSLGISDSETSFRMLFFNMSIPFVDVNTIFGWFVMWIVQFNLGLAYALSMTSITSYFISCTFYIKALCEHLNVMMLSIHINSEPEKKSSKVTPKSSQNEKMSLFVEKRQQMGNVIKFQIQIIE